MNTNKRTHLLALAIVFSLVALPVLAQDGKEPQITGGATVGAQTGTGINDSSKLQQYETVPKGVTLFDVDFGWKNAASYFMTFEGTKLGLDDQYAAFETGKKGAWAITAALNQNPRWFSNTAATLYNQSAPGVFTLPDGMRSSLQKIWYPATGETAAPANSNDARFWSLRDYQNGAQPVDLKYVRKTGGVAFDLTAIKDWTFKLSYQKETRNGTQPVAFTAGPGIDEIANPIQYTTQDTRGEAEYIKKNFLVNAAFSNSRFTNGVPYSVIDNPVRLMDTDYFWTAKPVIATSTTSEARLWNAPDNTANSFDLTAALKLPMRHKVTFTTSYTSMTMDRTLVAQALNPNLNLATTSADYGKFTLVPEYSAINAKLKQTLFQVNFSGDPSPKLGYSAYYRAFDVANEKPAYTFHSTVNSDGGASYSAAGTTSTEDMGGYSTGQFKAEGHFNVVKGFRVGVNAGQLKSTYEDRMYVDTKETTVGVTADATVRWAMLHGSFSNVSRQPGAIDPDEPAEGTTGGPLDINADMKDVAKMDGKLYNVALTLTPLDKAAFTFSVQGMNSDFPDVSIGLKKSTVKNYGFDFVYAFNEKVGVNAGYVYETYHMDSNLWYGANGTVSNPIATNTTDKYGNAIDDKVDTVDAGVRLDIIPGRFDIRSDYSYSKGRSDSGFTIVPGGQAGGDMYFPTNTTTVNFTQGQYLSMPQVFNATTIWKTSFNYHVEKNLTVSLLYWHQKFDQADYAYDMLAPYMLAGSALYATTPGAVTNIYPTLDASANRAMFLNAGVPNYNANIVRVSLSYRF
jgi:MtrB/PioB family decaheme-associated outer membrane protein